MQRLPPAAQSSVDACCPGSEHGGMTTPDIRWIQRLENFQRALATLQRAIDLGLSRPLSELEEQGLIQAFEFPMNSVGC